MTLSSSNAADAGRAPRAAQLFWSRYFTVYDTLRYKTALEELVRQEVDVVMNRLAGEVPPERVVEMLEAGAQPLKDLIASLHTKLLVAELEDRRG